MPMLEEDEWQQLAPLLSSFVEDVKRHREYHSSLVQEASGAISPDPALQKYFELTGFRETNINALWHHRASLHGDPCPRCAKPLRTRVAKLCVECGWRTPNSNFKDDDYASLVDHFEHLGYHVSRQRLGTADTIVVANKPETTAGVAVYQRSVHLHQSSTGRWHTSVGGVTLAWTEDIDGLLGFVSDLMESEDAAYFGEQQRRLRSVNGRAQ